MSCAASGYTAQTSKLDAGSPSALDEAIAFIAEDAPGLAGRLLNRSLDAAASLDTLSQRG